MRTTRTHVLLHDCEAFIGPDAAACSTVSTAPASSPAWTNRRSRPAIDGYRPLGLRERTCAPLRRRPRTRGLSTGTGGLDRGVEAPRRFVCPATPVIGVDGDRRQRRTSCSPSGWTALGLGRRLPRWTTVALVSLRSADSGGPTSTTTPAPSVAVHRLLARTPCGIDHLHLPLRADRDLAHRVRNLGDRLARPAPRWQPSSCE